MTEIVGAGDGDGSILSITGPKGCGREFGGADGGEGGVCGDVSSGTSSTTSSTPAPNAATGSTHLFRRRFCQHFIKLEEEGAAPSSDVGATPSACATSCSSSCASSGTVCAVNCKRRVDMISGRRAHPDMSAREVRRGEGRENGIYMWENIFTMRGGAEGREGRPLTRPLARPKARTILRLRRATSRGAAWCKRANL